MSSLRLRLWLWLTAPLPCKFGFHTQGNNSWGFGGAVVDWYCTACERRIGYTPLDDLSDEMRAEVNDLAVRFGMSGEAEP